MEKAQFSESAEAQMVSKPCGGSGVKLGGIFVVDCFDRDGNLKWSETASNIVTNQGIQTLLDVGFTGATYISPWYIGLMATTGILATHTMAAHTGLTEATEYSQATRPIYVEVRSGQSLTNAAGKATYTINANLTTIEGAFLTSSNTKNGTAGVLMSGAPFTGGVKVGSSGDSLQVTYTFSAADDGV
uniref:Uncharacterized protein n=1 Tax=viral metagenome TaxID=1070528 RepID=A0A6M3KXH9_9ZZZZ